MKSPKTPHLSSRKQPKQARSSRLVADILEAAVQVLSREGARRFTTARVAERAGISVGSLYQYFPNKEAILFRLQADEWRQTGALLQDILADRSLPPAERLRTLVRAFFRSECEEAALRLALGDAAPLYRDAPETQRAPQGRRSPGAGVHARGAAGHKAGRPGARGGGDDDHDGGGREIRVGGRALARRRRQDRRGDGRHVLRPSRPPECRMTPLPRCCVVAVPDCSGDLRYMGKFDLARLKEGLPHPLGATWDGKGTNFALFSAQRDQGRGLPVRSEDRRGDRAHRAARIHRPGLARLSARRRAGQLLRLPRARPLRAGGRPPLQSEQAAARSLCARPCRRADLGSGGVRLHSWNRATTRPSTSATARPSCRNASWSIPTSTGAASPAGSSCRGTTPSSTRCTCGASPSCIPRCPKRLRGTYAGLGNKDVVGYIKSLGVTSVELLPIHTFVNDSYLLDKKLRNYWGYNTIGFFAPDPRYASDVPNSLREFKEMVARFHDAGLEVILDVVYNHTAEGNERGPTLSFKGIDNASYYRLLPDQKRYYINDTGTGNTLNLSHPRVIQMVTDSLRYWAQEMHVDGFRFDLGTILAREPNGFDEQSGFLKACRAGSGARQREADRRAVGLRSRRLPGRRLSARLGGMERQVPRHGARLLARRGGRHGARAAPVRLGRHLQSRRPARLGVRQLHHRA